MFQFFNIVIKKIFFHFCIGFRFVNSLTKHQYKSSGFDAFLKQVCCTTFHMQIVLGNVDSFHITYIYVILRIY